MSEPKIIWFKVSEQSLLKQMISYFSEWMRWMLGMDLYEILTV